MKQTNPTAEEEGSIGEQNGVKFSVGEGIELGVKWGGVV